MELLQPIAGKTVEPMVSVMMIFAGYRLQTSGLDSVTALIWYIIKSNRVLMSRLKGSPHADMRMVRFTTPCAGPEEIP